MTNLRLTPRVVNYGTKIALTVKKPARSYSTRSALRKLTQKAKDTRDIIVRIQVTFNTTKYNS